MPGIRRRGYCQPAKCRVRRLVVARLNREKSHLANFPVPYDVDRYAPLGYRPTSCGYVEQDIVALDYRRVCEVFAVCGVCQVIGVTEYDARTESGTVECSRLKRHGTPCGVRTAGSDDGYFRYEPPDYCRYPEESQPAIVGG